MEKSKGVKVCGNLSLYISASALIRRLGFVMSEAEVPRGPAPSQRGSSADLDHLSSQLARLLTSEKLTECLEAPGSLLDLPIPILAVEDSRLLAGTLPRQTTHAFLGISKGTALVCPPQKPEPGIEAGIPEKVTQISTRCGLSMVNKYLTEG